MKRRTIVIISVIVLVLLGVAGWNVYGWWLKHKLERYQAQLVARGEKLAVRELLADRREPPVNAADWFNRATAFLYPTGPARTNAPETMRFMAPGKARIGWKQPVLIERYSKTPATNTWAELREDLERSREGIALLHQVIDHPDLDFHLNYQAGPAMRLSHLAPLKGATQVLAAAAMVDLQDGQAASAVQHVRAMLAITKGIRSESLLISQLVRIAVMQITINVTWELLQSATVSDADLKLLQDDFAALDFVGPLEHAFEMERATGSITIRHYREQGGIFEMWGTPGAPASTNLAEVIQERAKKTFSPTELRKNSNELLWQSALSYEDELRHLQGMTVLIEALRQAATNRASAAVISNATVQLEATGLLAQGDEAGDVFGGSDEVSLASIREMFSGSGRWSLKCLNKVQLIEAQRSLVTTAIALKRYELHYGSMPRELSALVPAFLAEAPRDPVDGKLLRYRFQEGGKWWLYSVGENRVDDGGDPALTNSTSRPNLMKGRDWVWPQPATSEEINEWEAKELRRN